MKRHIAAAFAGLLAASPAFADPAYSISTPDAALTGMVTGSSLNVRLGAPSSALLSKATLKLNGADVTSQVHADGAGSMSGVVSGLQAGANVLQLWAKNSAEALATLTVMKAQSPTVTCASLATLTDFPVQPSGTMGGTRITSSALATDANGTQYCLVQGIMEERNDGVAGIAGTSSYRTNQHYGTLFEVRLPTAWNGRYMFQGSGGTEGNRPGATGQIGGTAGLSILRNGFVVASQNGGHQTNELPPSYSNDPSNPNTTDLNHILVIQGNMFFPDAKAVADWGYHSIDITTQTTKYLINAYYGRSQDHSYFVGCSTSGRQGMAMSQLFPQHFDGIVAGDPFYLPPEISLSETWGLEHIIAVSPINNGVPQYLQSFTLADQNLFTNAILAACDGNDGLVDGVIEDMKACSFDPATFVFPAAGPYGSIAPGLPLQCTGAKTATCLTPAQVNAAKRIDEGPRNSNGERITTPDGTTLSGYPSCAGLRRSAWPRSPGPA
jgi:feruloyl esterase